MTETKKYCPLIKGNCKGKRCVNWGFVYNDYKSSRYGFGIEKYRPNYGCRYFNEAVVKGRWKKS